jgi:hypothetical protein
MAGAVSLLRLGGIGRFDRYWFEEAKHVDTLPNLAPFLSGVTHPASEFYDLSG